MVCFKITVSLKKGLTEPSQHALRKASAVKIIWFLMSWPYCRNTFDREETHYSTVNFLKLMIIILNKQ